MSGKGTRIAFATSCDLNYLEQAHTLALSVKNIYPNAQFFLALNENEVKLETEIKSLTDVFDYVLVGKDLHPKYPELDERYGVIEICCATKPALLTRCFDEGFEQVFYLDPDAYLVSTLTESTEFLAKKGSDAVFTPHLTKLGTLEIEISAMKHGILNLGFLGLNNNARTRSFLEWWNSRLETLCIKDYERGIFTDQTWAGLAVGVLSNKIIRDPGYNFATWNLPDHVVGKKQSEYYIDDNKLVFAHFSTFLSGGIEDFINKFNIPVTPAFYELLAEYRESVTYSRNLLSEVIKKKTVKVHYKGKTKNDLPSANFKNFTITLLKKYFPAGLRAIILLKRKLKLSRA